MDFKKLANQYKSELLDSVMPFWVGKSQDKEYGGYFSCLDNAGNVYDTDKFVWMQGREVWMFSMLYNKVERRKVSLGGKNGEFYAVKEGLKKGERVVISGLQKAQSGTTVTPIMNKEQPPAGAAK